MRLFNSWDAIAFVTIAVLAVVIPALANLFKRSKLLAAAFLAGVAGLGAVVVLPHLGRTPLPEPPNVALEIPPLPVEIPPPVVVSPKTEPSPVEAPPAVESKPSIGPIYTTPVYTPPSLKSEPPNRVTVHCPNSRDAMEVPDSANSEFRCKACLELHKVGDLIERERSALAERRTEAARKSLEEAKFLASVERTTPIARNFVAWGKCPQCNQCGLYLGDGIGKAHFCSNCKQRSASETLISRHASSCKLDHVNAMCSFCGALHGVGNMPFYSCGRCKAPNTTATSKEFFGDFKAGRDLTVLGKPEKYIDYPVLQTLGEPPAVLGVGVR